MSEKIWEELMRNPKIENLDYVIIEYIDIKEFELINSDVNDFGILDNITANSKPNLKMAFVTTNNKVTEMIEFYKDIMKSTSWKLKTFTNVDEATNWCK